MQKRRSDRGWEAAVAIPLQVELYEFDPPSQYPEPLATEPFSKEKPRFTTHIAAKIISHQRSKSGCQCSDSIFGLRFTVSGQTTQR